MRALVLCGLLAAVAGAEDWRYPRGDVANTGVVKNRGPTKKPDVKWKREEKNPIGGGAALAGGHLVYNAGEYLMACRRTSSGSVVWDFKVKQQVVAWPLILGEFVYFGGQDHVHYHVRMSDSKEPDSHEAQGPIVADPIVVGDHYVQGCTDGNLYAMHAEKGSLLWKRQIGSVRHGAAASRRRVFVVNELGTLHAFELKKGKETWRHETKQTPLCSPVLAKGVVYLVVPDRVEMFKEKKGEPIGGFDTKGIVGGPVLEKTLLHYGTSGGEVVTLDLKNKGAEVRRVKVAETAVSTPLVLAGKTLYGAAGTTLFAIDNKKGKILWTHEGEEMWTPPIVADKCLYAGSGRTFYCLK